MERSRPQQTAEVERRRRLVGGGLTELSTAANPPAHYESVDFRHDRYVIEQPGEPEIATPLFSCLHIAAIFADDALHAPCLPKVFEP